MKTKQDREPMAISDLGVWLGCLSCRKVVVDVSWAFALYRAWLGGVLAGKP